MRALIHLAFLALLMHLSPILRIAHSNAPFSQFCEFAHSNAPFSTFYIHLSPNYLSCKKSFHHINFKIGLLLGIIQFGNSTYLQQLQSFIKLLHIRGGVKLEFVRNSFDSIRKFTIRLIRKGKKSSKNSIIFNSKFVRFERK